MHSKGPNDNSMLLKMNFSQIQQILPNILRYEHKQTELHNTNTHTCTAAIDYHQQLVAYTACTMDRT